MKKAEPAPTDPKFYEPRTLKDWQNTLSNGVLKNRFDLIRKDVRLCLAGKIPAVCVAGGSGIGKSYLLRQVLSEQGYTENRFSTPRPSSYNDLIEAFGKASRLKIPMLLEECDSVLTLPNCVNELKKAGDMTGIRYVDRYKTDGSGKSINSDYVRYYLTAPLLISTNLDVHKHLDPALINRWNPVELPSDRATIWEYAVSLAINEGLIRFVPDGTKIVKGKTLPKKRKLSSAVQNRLLAFFTENLWTLKNVSVRTLLDMAFQMSLCLDDKGNVIESDWKLTASRYLPDQPDPAEVQRRVPANPTVPFVIVSNGTTRLSDRAITM